MLNSNIFTNLQQSVARRQFFKSALTPPQDSMREVSDIGVSRSYFNITGSAGSADILKSNSTLL